MTYSRALTRRVLWLASVAVALLVLAGWWHRHRAMRVAVAEKQKCPCHACPLLTGHRLARAPRPAYIRRISGWNGKSAPRWRGLCRTS